MHEAVVDERLESIVVRVKTCEHRLLLEEENWVEKLVLRSVLRILKTAGENLGRDFHCWFHLGWQFLFNHRWAHTTDLIPRVLFRCRHPFLHHLMQGIRMNPEKFQVTPVVIQVMPGETSVVVELALTAEDAHV